MIHSDASSTPMRSIKYRDLFESMLVAGAVRGTDSTGAYQVTSRGDVFYAKSALASGAAVKEDKPLKNIIGSVDDSPINVGHVRAATQGEVNEDNSHPFIGFKDDANKNYLIGVHNGTLYGWEYYDETTAHTVDSAWAIEHIAKHGAKAFEDFYGAYAFVWYDTSSPNKVFFTRNKERPLHIARSSDGHSIIGASEAGMLQWLAARHDISIGEVYSVEPGSIYSIDTSEEKLSVQWEEDVPEYAGSTNTMYDRWGRTVPAKREETKGLPAPIMASIEWEPSANPKKERTIEAVKAALRNARYKKVGPVDDEDTPFEMGPVEVRVRAKADWYSDMDATEDERKRALYDGSYGQVVAFEGITFDHFNDTIVGEIQMPSAFKGALAYLPTNGPYEFNYYEDRRVPMVVVGARTHGGELEYIVTPLNEKGEEALAA